MPYKPSALILSLLVVAVAPLTAAHAFAPKPKPAEDAGEKAADSQDKIICKRFTRIGSLVDSYRVCHTKREWEHERTNINSPGAVGHCNEMFGQGC